MKYFIGFIFCILLFSFQKKSQTKEEFKFVLLKKEDWKELEKFSVHGATTSTLVHQTSRANILNTTQYKSKDATLSEKQKTVLRKILKKYE